MIPPKDSLLKGPEQEETIDRTKQAALAQSTEVLAARVTVVRASLWPLIAFVLALIPRIIALSARPFWLDEAFTLQRASLSPAALVLDSFQNHHTPSFFLMLSPLVHLGHPEFWLRLPSALFGAAAVALIFIIAAKIMGRLAGMLASLIFGLSPMALAFSQEARSYTLDACLILVALYGVVSLVQAPAIASQPLFSHRSRSGWLIFVCGTAAAINVLADALFWLIAANLTFCLLLLVVPRRAILLCNLALANIVIAALCAPLYALMFQYQKMAPGAAMGWIPPLTVNRLWYSLGSIYFMHIADWVSFHLLKVPTPNILIWSIDALLLAALLAAVAYLRNRPGILLVLAISTTLPPVLFSIVSIWKPILLPRYLLWSDAPFAILAGVGLATILNRWGPRIRYMGAALVAVALLVNMISYYQIETKPRWDIAAKQLSQAVEPGDVIYLDDRYAKRLLNLYLPKDKISAFRRLYVTDINSAIQLGNQGRRVWIVVGNAGQLANNPDIHSFLIMAKSLGAPRRLQIVGTHIVIIFYAPASKHFLALPSSPSAKY